MIIAAIVKAGNIMIDLRQLGEFEIILADPPWQYHQNSNAAIGKTHIANSSMQYATMTTGEIKNIQVPCAKNSLLFLWTTAPLLDEGIDVLKAWGYKYKSNSVWYKYNRLGLGFYFRIDHEHLLLGIRGNVKCPEVNDRPSSVFNSPLKKHSQKPDLVYDMIERMYPNMSKIELFARKRREGWTAWGNQVNDTIQMTLKINRIIA